MISAKGPNVPANEMNYADFYIRYDHTFLRNNTQKKLETPQE